VYIVNSSDYIGQKDILKLDQNFEVEYVELENTAPFFVARLVDIQIPI
jgi:hypothetical protein